MAEKLHNDMNRLPDANQVDDPDFIPSAQALVQAFRGAMEDLYANQQGGLGANQRDRLHRLRQRALWVGASVFFALVLMATIFLFLGQTNANGVLTIIGILMTMLNAVATGIFARQWMRLSADLASETVEVMQGNLERVIRPSGRVSNFVLRLNGRDFEVDKSLFKLFRHEVFYTFYYAPHSGILLGAEPRL